MQEPRQAAWSRFVAECDFEKIDERFKADARLRVLDWLGCAVAGKDYPQTQMARAMLGEAGGRPECTVAGSSTRLPARSAAYINGVAGHVCELDDGHRTAIGHAGSITLPPALALAQAVGASGADFLKAVILGYDAFARLGRTVNPVHYKTWHTTGTVGTIAAAVAAASLLKLNAEQTNNAVGIAATSAGGLVESFGTHAKAVNIALACQNGVDSARLAAMGFTGSPSALLGKKGFVAATCTEPHLENLNNFSEEGLVSDTAFFKKYSSCGHTNSPLDGLCALMKAHPDITPENVKSIRVGTYRVSVDITAALKCATEDEAKFSVPYCFAVQIACGRVGLTQFTPQMRSDAGILDLARKVHVEEDPEATAAFPRRMATVTVELNDGTVYVEKRLNASDEADAALVEAKFAEAAAVLGSDKVARVIDLCRRIDSLDSIEELAQVLC